MSALTAFVLSTQTSSIGGLYSLTPVSSSVSSISQSTSQSTPLLVQDQTQLSGYGQLLSALSNFQYTLQGMELPNTVAQNLATSSNSSVATATTSTGAIPSTYNIAVTSLAQALSVDSAAFADPNSTIVGSGTLNIQLGTYNSGPNTFTPTSAPSVAVSISNGSLNSIASSINAANAGISATVLQDVNGYHLLVSSSNPGIPNGFSITVQDSDGTNTNTSGLSQLAFDPTAAVGSGKNMTQTQSATNAAYSVNGAAAISTTNSGISLAQGVSLNLLQTGNATITAGPDFSSLQTSAQNFTSAYNTLQNTIMNLTGTSGPLANDAVISMQLASDLNQAAQGSYSNGNSLLTTLSQIGINFQYSANFWSGGTLTLDANTLQNAFNSDTAGTVSLLSQAIQGFDSLAQQYAGAGGSISTASQFLQQATWEQQYFSLQQNYFSQANSLPTISELLGAQSTSSSGVAYTSQQLQAIQQYAQAAMLSNPFSLDAAIVSTILGGIGSSLGSSISTFA